MSGTHKKTDGFTYLLTDLDKVSSAYIVSIFDEQHKKDVEDIIVEAEEMKTYRKLCLLKTLIFPYELLLTFIILGKNNAKDKIKSQSLYWKMLRKKVTIIQFKKQIVKLIRAP